MKPPTTSELRDIAGDYHGGADFHRHQLVNSNLSESERDTERFMERKNKLIALACERWAEQIDAKVKGA